MKKISDYLGLSGVSIGGWYQPKQDLEALPNVKWVRLENMTSSAGDWDGVMCVELDGMQYVMRFSQMNRWPSDDGFEWYIEDVVLAEFAEDEDSKVIEEQVQFRLWYEGLSPEYMRGLYEGVATQKDPLFVDIDDYLFNKFKEQYDAGI